MKALITGGHGFVGRYTARCFAQAGYAVSGIGHGAWAPAESGAYGVSQWHAADVDLASLAALADRPDVIVHCAGSGSVGFSMSNPYEDFSRAVQTTFAVLEYIRRFSPGTVLVYPSSAAVYGAAKVLPIHESAPLRPASPYGVHKQMAEQACQSYAAHFGISTAAVRLFSIYGEGQRKQLLWDACGKIARSNAEFSGSGAELRDWLHVEDAASLMLLAVRHAGPHCPIVNAGSGEGVSIRDVVTEILKCFEAPAAPVFNGQSRPGDPPGLHADIAAARAWGWTPCVPWRKGIERYVKWFKDQAM